MRILVNYDRKDQSYLTILQYHIKQRGYEAIATSSELTLADMVMKAKSSHCDAILLCNEQTLANCVPGSKPTLDDYRGSRLNFSVPTIVCNSLAHTVTVPYGSWLLGKDLDKFKTLNNKTEEFTFKVLESTKDFEVAFASISRSILIAYDIETKTINEDEDLCLAGDTLITCCAWSCLYADGKIDTFVLPFIDFNEDHWHTDELYAQAILLLRRINSTNIPKVMHNGMYDSLHSISYHAEPINWTLDTMAMAHSEYSELPKTLDFVASLTLHDYIQWKNEASAASKEKDIHRYWGYNAKDTFTTLRICMHYLRNLPQYARVNYGNQFKFVYPALYCAYEGIKVSPEIRNQLRTEAQRKVDEHLARLRKMVDDENFNPASPKQVQQYVYDVFGARDPGIGQKKDSTTGKRTKMVRGTNEKNLKAVGEQHPILLRFTDSLLEYRENAKAISTYFDFLQKNGRLLYNLNPFGTDTGRMSCQSSSFWCGTQAQNIPPYAKKMLVADEGFIMAEVDNSQSEARCTAYLSQDLKLIAALEDKEKDFYTTLGTLFFQIPYENVTKEFRNKILKKIVHGTNYMMGANTFIENAGIQNLLVGAEPLKLKIVLHDKPTNGEITIKQFAKQLLDAYHIPFYRVREWYKEIAASIQMTHTLRSPLGHTRYFFGDIQKNHNLLRSAVAHAPQNLSVSILNIGLWKVWELVKESNGDLRLKAQIHDSVLFQFKKDRPELLDRVLECLNNPVTIHGRTLLIPIDHKMGDSWGAMKD